MTQQTQLSISISALFAAMPIKPELVEDLAESMRKVGQLVPIKRVGGVVIDGRHRELACQKVGVTPIYHDLDPGEENPQAGADLSVALNLVRQHLTVSERALIAAAYANLSKGDNQHSKGLSRKSLSRSLAVSEDSIDRTKKVLESGRADLIAELKAGGSPSRAARLVAAPKSPTMRLPPVPSKRTDGWDALVRTAPKARILFVNAARLAHQGSIRTKKSTSEAESNGLDVQALGCYDVGALAAKDSICCLWVPVTHLGEGIDFLRQWGFPKIVTSLVWDCSHDAGTSDFFLKPGHGEILVGQRGAGLPVLPHNPMLRDSMCGDLQKGVPLASSHTAQRFAKAFPLLYPELPKIELFGFEPTEGWTCWGTDQEIEARFDSNASALPHAA